MKARTFLLAIATVGLVLPATSSLAQKVYSGEGPLLLTSSQLTWADAPAVASGAKIAVIEGPLDKPVPFTFRLALPANTKIAPHTHPAFERVTVLSGTFYFTAGDKYDPAKAQALDPGSVAILPPGTPMFGYTKEDTVIQLHGVGPWGLSYVNPADDPRRQ